MMKAILNTIFLFLISIAIHSQSLNMDTFKMNSAKDTLIIDVENGSCFGGKWKKFVISKPNSSKEEYQMILIDDFSKVLTLTKETFDSLDAIDLWANNNLELISKTFVPRKIDQKELDKILAAIQALLTKTEACNSPIEGDFTRVKLRHKKVLFEKQFLCNVALQY